MLGLWWEMTGDSVEPLLRGPGPDTPPLHVCLQEQPVLTENQDAVQPLNHNRTPPHQAFSTQSNCVEATANSCYPHTGGGCREKAGPCTLAEIRVPGATAVAPASEDLAWGSSGLGKQPPDAGELPTQCGCPSWAPALATFPFFH